MKLNLLFYGFSIAFLIWNCSSNENKAKMQSPDLAAEELISEPIPSHLAHSDTVYVPIYSEIFSRNENSQLLLTATLSIHNTSLNDSIYIRFADYYSTDGKLISQYIPKGKWLKPLQTKNIVIDQINDKGGVGSNFVVYWGANKKGLKPLIQSVMVIADGHTSFAFTADGVSTTKNEQP